ncbi:MAG TPA: thioredoxin family protein [bacterium]|nr:thioredoxin family protein [bacterium]
MRPLRPAIALLLLTALGPLAVLAQDDTAATPPAAGDSAPAPVWQESFDRAVGIATGERRQMLLVFQTEWCPWSRAMNESTWTDTQILERAKTLVFVRIDGDLDTATVSRFRVSRFPTTILATDKAVEVDRFVGYFGPRELDKELTRALEGTGTVWELERLTSETKNDPKVLLALGKKYIERNEFDRAAEYLSRAKLLDQDGGLGVVDDILFTEARIERERKNWYKAIEIFKKLIKDHPESEWREDSELYTAWLYAQASDRKEATKRFTQFLKERSGSSETQWVQRQLNRLAAADSAAASSANQGSQTP